MLHSQIFSVGKSRGYGHHSVISPMSIQLAGQMLELFLRLLTILERLNSSNILVLLKKVLNLMSTMDTLLM